MCGPEPGHVSGTVCPHLLSLVVGQQRLQVDQRLLNHLLVDQVQLETGVHGVGQAQLTLGTQRGTLRGHTGTLPLTLDP